MPTDEKISELAAAVSVDPSDKIPILQAGATKSATAAQVAALGGGGGSVPTGTGFTHITGGSQDAAAKKVDLTASADVTVPSAGVVHSDGSVLSSGDVDLAADVTGTLPVANGGTGTTTSTGTGDTVRATSPTLVTPALGVASATSVTASSTLYGTASVGTASGGFLSIGSRTITSGAGIPASAESDGSIYLRTDGTGVTGVYTRQAGAWAALGGGGGGAAGSTANEVQTTDGAGNFQAAENVRAVSGGFEIGATVASDGTIKLATGAKIKARNAGNSADIQIAEVDASNDVYLGCNSANSADSRYLYLRGNSGTRLGYAGGNYLDIGIDGLVYNKLPIVGLSSPYGVHGFVTVTSADGGVALSAAQYSRRMLLLDTGATGLWTMTVPNPTNDDHAYYFYVNNQSGHDVTITAGAGTSYTLMSGLKGWIQVRNNFVTIM